MLPRLALAAIPLALVLSACGGGEPDERPRPSVTNTASSLTEPARTLAETCPEIEAALIPYADGASAAELREQAKRLGEVYDAGDTESRNALELMVDPLADFISARERDVVGIELLDAM